MKKYTVTGSANIICSMVVEAETEEEAIEKANEEFGSLSNYVGMGSNCRLIGVLTAEDERCIYPDSDPEFDEAEPYAEEQREINYEL